MSNMVTNSLYKEYTAPVCDLSVAVPSILCESQDGMTEPFEDLGTFEW